MSDLTTEAGVVAFCINTVDRQGRWRGSLADAARIARAMRLLAAWEAADETGGNDEWGMGHDSALRALGDAADAWG